MNNQQNDEREAQEFCFYCGLVDSEYDELSVAEHTAGPKHNCNKILHEFSLVKKDFVPNRNGIRIMASAEVKTNDDTYNPLVTTIENTDESSISISVKPKQKAKIFFEVSSDLNNESVLLISIQLAHPQHQFVMNDHSFTDAHEPVVLTKKSTITDEISVTFEAADIGQYEMPIMFTFQTNKICYGENDKNEYFLIVRDIVIHVEENPVQRKRVPLHTPSMYPELPILSDVAQDPMTSSITEGVPENFELPESVKIILNLGLRDETLDYLRGMNDQVKAEELKKIFYELRTLFSQEITKKNYVKYFHYLLWWEEIEDVTSRVSLGRCHEALQRLEDSGDFSRIFPKPIGRTIPILKPINIFFNRYIARNEQQKSAVEHIVAGSSGLAPYIVFGPPGTGKTITIVEAILRLVVSNSRNRVMVCTDSNMAADHIALTLLKYRHITNSKYFLLRANSQNREWSSMPSRLSSVSNPRNFNTFKMITNKKLAEYRVVVTTLQNAGKYASEANQSQHKLTVSHLFIDEASQGSEPAVLIPITGLLEPTGHLILAGDPRQLGPVCVSKQASKRGLGTSLLERLYRTKKNLYDNNPTYITTLVKNFRSHSDILQIPNELFYDNQLQSLAPMDELSELSILGLPGGDRAIVFHSVHSNEQKLEQGVSFYNDNELEMVRRYVKALIEKHDVLPEEIGVITPYAIQVSKIIYLLKDLGYEKVEAGTVEAFQGKEKRVIIVSMVRANCKLLDCDARYEMGFVVDEKRFNVTITRAKSKLVIIGNETCLKRDVKWRIYMDRCRQYNTYFGKENEQMNRNTKLLLEVAQARFKKCRLTDILKDIKSKKNKQN